MFSSDTNYLDPHRIKWDAIMGCQEFHSREFIKGPFSAITNPDRPIKTLPSSAELAWEMGIPDFATYLLAFQLVSGQPKRTSRIFGHAVSQ